MADAGGALLLAAIVIGIGIDTELLHDAWSFALVLVLLNMVKVFAQNCTRDAPLVRGWLTLTAYRARQEIKERGEEIAAGDTVPVLGT